MDSTELMPPYNQFRQKVKDLMNSKGCTFDVAFNTAQKEYGNRADQADNWLDMKQQLEWELKFGKNGN